MVQRKVLCVTAVSARAYMPGKVSASEELLINAGHTGLCIVFVGLL